tara:strand:- start:1538 stop:2044 length:507 start_codon:yes stop_codon:yes gene_type:complete
MAQEFVIKSEAIEDKINQLLPSQGGFQAGVDFSASTMVIPIVDLTETASGSALRVDLQSSFSKNSTYNAVAGGTTTLVNTTGYYRVFGTCALANGGAETATILINDGTSTYNIFVANNLNTEDLNISFDFIVLLKAGDSLQAVSSAADIYMNCTTRQIADLSGNLINP